MKAISVILILIFLIGCSENKENKKESAVGNDTIAVNQDIVVESQAEPESDKFDFSKYVIIESGQQNDIVFTCEDTVDFYLGGNIHIVSNDSASNYKEYWSLFKYERGVFYMEKIKVKRELYTVPTGASFNRFYTNSKKKPLYIFDGLNISSQYLFNAKSIKSYPLRPSELYSFQSDNERSVIYVTGSVFKTEKAKFGNPFNIVTDYSINIQTKTNEAEVDNVFFQKDTMLINTDSFEENIGQIKRGKTSNYWNKLLMH